MWGAGRVALRVAWPAEEEQEKEEQQHVFVAAVVATRSGGFIRPPFYPGEVNDASIESSNYCKISRDVLLQYMVVFETVYNSCYGSD